MQCNLDDLLRSPNKIYTKKDVELELYEFLDVILNDLKKETNLGKEKYLSKNTSDNVRSKLYSER